MQLTIIEYSNDILEAKEKEITVNIADFDTGVGAVPLSVIEAKGDIIVGTDDDQIVNLTVGTDGHVLTVDSTEESGVKWAAPSGTIASLERESTLMVGDLTLYDSDVKYQFLDPDSTGRIVTLPAEAVTNHSFVIINTSGNIWEDITVKNDAGVIICKIPAGNSREIRSNETAWKAETKYKQIWVAGWKPTLTAGCASSAQIEMGTNKNVYDYLAFDKDTIEYAYANVPMPDDYTGGTVLFRVYWFHPATTTNFKVSWGLQGVSLASGDTMDVAQGTAIYSNDTGGTTSDVYLSPVSGSVTIAGTPASTELVNFRVSRKANDSTNDTLAVDAYLLGVMIWYPVG